MKQRLKNGIVETSLVKEINKLINENYLRVEIFDLARSINNN